VLLYDRRAAIGPLPHGTLLTDRCRSARRSDPDAEVADDLVRMVDSPALRPPLREPGRYFTPFVGQLVVAANTQTAQTMANPTATIGTMIASLRESGRRTRPRRNARHDQMAEHPLGEICGILLWHRASPP